MHKERQTPMARACKIALAVMAMSAASQAIAGPFTTDDGLEGQWSLNATYGASWRAANRDPNLVSAANGGTAGVGNGHDDGNLNFDKGSLFSLNHLLPALLATNFDHVTTFGCPVIVYVGAHDYTTPHELAEEWFANIKAPSKKLVT